MKRNSILMLAAGAALSLASCANEETLAGFADFEGGIPVRVEVSVPEADATRTNLTEVAGNLKWEWSETDQLLVTTTDGAYAGTLNLKEITNDAKTNAVFEGNLNPSLANGELSLNFTYTGDTEPLAAKNPFVVEFDSQDGSFDALKGRDIITTTVKANKTSNYISIPDFSMRHYLSAGHFELVFEDTSVQLQSVSISGTGLKNKSSLNLGNLNWTDSEGSIAVDPAMKDFYVTLAPSNGLDMLFTAVTTDGKTFEGSMGVVFDLPSGRYLRRQIANSDPSLDESYVGIPITMTEKAAENPGGDYGEDDPDYPDYANEDTRNPLHKFAKYNLVRVGERGSLVNGFAEDSADHGALYQWGRNYGYMDTKGIYGNGILTIDDKYINFVDALGDFDNLDAVTSRQLDYYVYNPNSNRYFMTSGTAMRYTPKEEYILWYDVPHFYTDKQDLIDHPDKYFMDGTPGNRYMSYGTYGIGGEVKDYKEDYWLTSFGNGGSVWEKRAEACGYEKTNPCPEGWSLPSIEDYKAIAPEEGLDIIGNLYSQLNNYYEDRQTTDGIRYIIRWNYTSQDDAITIEAVVVDKDFSETVNSLFWDKHRNDKVVRVFPFTGVIQPLIFLSDGLYMASEEYVVRPHHRGCLDFTGYPGGYGESNNFIWTLVGPADMNYGNRSFGGYWVKEKGSAFMFEASEKRGGTNTSNQTISKASCLMTSEKCSPVMAYAIRPVMSKYSAEE